MNRGKFNATLLLSLSLLAGCATTPKVGGDPNLRILPGTELPAPHRGDLTARAADYYVGPFDKLTIDVFGIEDLSQRSVQVDASGKIRFPLVGEVAVSGLTPNEIAEELTDDLQRAYVRDPQVTVNLAEVGSQLLTIDGQVQKPGLYPIVGRMTLMRAMALAEGTDEFAKLSDVVIFRTVNGQRMAALYNLKDIRHGAYPDPDVYANDVITVGDDKARRLFQDVLTTMPALLLLDRVIR